MSEDVHILYGAHRPGEAHPRVKPYEDRDVGDVVWSLIYRDCRIVEVAKGETGPIATVYDHVKLREVIEGLRKRPISGARPPDAAPADDCVSGTFGWALAKMKQGCLMRRPGWPEPDFVMWVPREVDAANDYIEYVFEPWPSRPDCPLVGEPWTPRHRDILANDWDTRGEKRTVAS